MNSTNFLQPSNNFSFLFFNTLKLKLEMLELLQVVGRLGRPRITGVQPELLGHASDTLVELLLDFSLRLFTVRGFGLWSFRHDLTLG